MQIASVMAGWGGPGLGVTQQQAEAAELLRSALVRLRAAAARCPPVEQNDWVHEIDPVWGFPAGSKCEMWTAEEVAAFMDARNVLRVAVRDAGGPTSDLVSPLVPDKISDVIPRLEQLLIEYTERIEKPLATVPTPAAKPVTDLEPRPRRVWPWVLAAIAGAGAVGTAVWYTRRRT
jgi:hypothetical protein